LLQGFLAVAVYALGDSLEARKPNGMSLLKNYFVASSDNAVRRQVQHTRVSPLKYLRFTPGHDLEAAPYITNADACAIARQLRRQLSRTISDYGISPPLPHLLRLWAKAEA
jgi:hypothetical protein